jgi:flavin-dependent dehydrogenase
MFSFFLLRALELSGIQIQLDIFEPRDFSFAGPAGCNHCGGIISESLVQMLAAEGITLPPEIVQRGIFSYVLHTDVGSVRIATPVDEKRIAAVYRGNGPKESCMVGKGGFDLFLLESAVAKGAHLHRKLVSKVEWREDGRPSLSSPESELGTYDVLVVATGVNSAARQLISEKALGLEKPSIVKTFISEFHLGSDRVNRTLGDAMHVFLLPLPRLEFAAIIPKGDYITVCMLGHGIDDGLVNTFMNSPEVRQCFPDATVPQQVCHCFPRMNVGRASRPYADRLVMIGDSGVTRLYKDGIGAAYRTAKAAAVTIAGEGFSEAAFSGHFRSACSRITSDNRLGALVFSGTELIKKVPRARRAILEIVDEELNSGGDRPLSNVLWDVFTGSAAYRDILGRSLHPKVWGRLLFKILSPGLNRDNKSRNVERISETY